MKISIIGTGRLGGLIAFLIADRGLADELVLIDVNKSHAEGQALDLRHAFFKSGKDIKISAGNYAAAKGSQIVIITAGKPRTATTASRSELMTENAKIIRQIAKELKTHCKDAVLITTTNPVDPINYLLWKETGFDRSKVIGFGGLLDSGRLGAILLEELKTTLSCDVIGEHGENMVPLFSRLKVPLSAEQKEKIKKQLLSSAKGVIEKKGATEYGPASHLLRIAEAIVKDKKETLPCSCILEGEYGIKDVSLGAPAIIGKKGIEKIEEWQLDKEETEILKKAGEKVQKEINQAHETLI